MRNTKLTKRSVLSILFIIFFVSISTLLAIFNSNKTYSVSSTDCSGVQMTLVDQATSGATVPLSANQISTFKIYIPTAIAQTTEIIISATDSATNSEIVIGKAKPLSSDTAGSASTAWDFVWPTFLWNRATSTSEIINISANIKFGGTGSCKFTSPTKYYIQYANNLNVPINLITIPTNIGVTTGSTNNIITAKPTIVSPITTISADTLLNYAVNYGMFEWSNDVGSISNSASTYVSSNVVYFNAGNSAGTGKVSVTLKYGGTTSNTASTPVTVKAVETVTTNNTSTTSNNSVAGSSTNSNTSNSSATATNSNNTTTTASTESKDVTTSELSTITQVSSSQISITNDIVACVKTGLGSDDRYITISSGKEHPTTAEYNKIYNCFASTKYVIPTVFLPVATTAVDELPTSNEVAVSALQNTTKKVDDTTKDLLKFTGKSKPNTKVFIYIFSDPLVIATTTDADGNWQYTLEDPLVPGKHEVYAVVNQGDGSYKRSDPISFFISEASASAVNPNKLSLKLAKTPTATQGNLFYYIAGSIGLLFFGLIILFMSLRIRKHRKTIAMIHGASCPNCNTPVHEILINNSNIAPTQTVNTQTPIEQQINNEQK